MKMNYVIVLLNYLLENKNFTHVLLKDRMNQNGIKNLFCKVNFIFLIINSSEINDANKSIKMELFDFK